MRAPARRVYDELGCAEFTMAVTQSVQETKALVAHTRLRILAVKLMLPQPTVFEEVA